MNCPRPENIERQWRPAPKKKVEEDEFIIRCVTEQTWTGLVIKNFGPEQGLGKTTFHLSSKGRGTIM